MSQIIARARSSWLITFGDVITLLLTFFVVMVVLYKGEVSRLQMWAETQMNHSYQSLQLAVEEKKLELVQVHRNANGIQLLINDERAFETGKALPSEHLQAELTAIGEILSAAPIFKSLEEVAGSDMLRIVEANGLTWLVDVSVEGHTDNDPVNPQSRLGSNWFLSTLRAQAVMNSLYETSALPATLFSVKGFGEFQPIVENISEESKAKNRRVEILITGFFQQNKAVTENLNK